MYRVIISRPKNRTFRFPKSGTSKYFQYALI
nr:MAG TPA: hypothetical protein [Caudoviricetes sp.]